MDPQLHRHHLETKMRQIMITKRIWIGATRSLCVAAGLAVALPVFLAGCAQSNELAHDHDHSHASHVFAICNDCGEIKGSDKCCKPEGRKKCPDCGLFKDSPGCCKLPKDATGPVALCADCGEIKGSDKCCKVEGRKKCPDCGMFKGSPGCCKLPKDEKK